MDLYSKVITSKQLNTREMSWSSCPVLLVSSSGSMATQWLSSVFNKLNVLSFHGEEIVADIFAICPQNVAVQYYENPFSVLSSYLKLKTAAIGNSPLVLIHIPGFHGGSAEKLARVLGMKSISLVRHPVLAIHSQFMAKLNSNLVRDTSKMKAYLNFLFSEGSRPQGTNPEDESSVRELFEFSRACAQYFSHVSSCIKEVEIERVYYFEEYTASDDSLASLIRSHPVLSTVSARDIEELRRGLPKKNMHLVAGTSVDSTVKIWEEKNLRAVYSAVRDRLLTMEGYRFLQKKYENS